MSAITRGAALVLGCAAGVYVTVAVLFAATAPHSALFWQGEVWWHWRAGALIGAVAGALSYARPSRWVLALAATLLVLSGVALWLMMNREFMASWWPGLWYK